MNRLAMTRRVVVRYLKNASSTLPGEVSQQTVQNIDESSPKTFEDNGPKRPKDIKEESIYEIDDADDIAKLSPGGVPRDMTDLTHLTPSYNTPSIPSNIRR